MNDNPYQAPQADVTCVSREEEIVAQLRRQQSVVGAILAGFIAPVFGMVVLQVLAGARVFPALVFVIPGLLSGVAIRLIARPFQVRVVLIGAAFATCSVIAYLLLSGTTVFALGVGILGCGGAVLIGQRSLTMEQEAALLRAGP